MKQKIVYYMQVDWDWIKQRPQFLAEELQRHFTVHVLYRRQFHRKELQKNTTGIVLHPFYTLPPCRDRFAALTRINSIIRAGRLRQLLHRTAPDWLWLTYPTQILEVPKNYTGPIVYDCMDDHLALACPPAFQKILPYAEERLCARAALIFVSSSALAEKLRARYRVPEDKLVLIRNGYSPQAFGDVKKPPAAHGSRFVAGYIGTIGEWFDFDLLLKSLDVFPDLEYKLIGPVRAKNAPQHPRIHYCGTVEHCHLPQATEDVDALIMPFRDNEIVRAVDPVKLYEYLALRRNIISLGYPEVRRFAKFVLTYGTAEEYLYALHSLMEKPDLRYTDEEADAFLAESTWKAREEKVYSILCRNHV